MRGFVFGVIVGVLLLAGGLFYYFVSGMAPAAAADAPMPMEKRIASRSLNAHIKNANVPAPPVAPNEENFLGGAKVYKNQCAGCHGLPNQPAPVIADKMYPHAPLLFKGKGVTDDPPQESYWKATNGIRLSGMPGFKDVLTDTELWQVAQLVANADKISDSVKSSPGCGAFAAGAHDFNFREIVQVAGRIWNSGFPQNVRPNVISLQTMR